MEFAAGAEEVQLAFGMFYWIWDLDCYGNELMRVIDSLLSIPLPCSGNPDWDVSAFVFYPR